MRDEKHFDRVVQPIFVQPVCLCNTSRSSPDMAYRLEDRINIFRCRTRIVCQTHHRSAVETNLTFNIYSRQFIIQFCQITLDFVSSHVRSRASLSDNQLGNRLQLHV